ncbi:uncharacterized protein BJ171DRAFT_441060 [Polychytrium aggregatum]|uniref:uncharacterized protein n=1 Tax=Polychytrium aggregatum TaxID=110093 RepID=UPI0022FF0842|nr:uncharacterized protein BJ171DRAFT_441060 [Polychytrium aggregatum]KAI9205874.1 hypothetical protein BJ171DRAFT_441060 [Polychytrium aggregatum]
MSIESLLDGYPAIFLSGLPFTITEMDLVRVLNDMRLETKVLMERDPVTSAPLGRHKLIFRHLIEAEKFYATVNQSMFLGSKVSCLFKDPNMNFSTTSGSKTIVFKHIPLGTTSLDLFDVVREFGRIMVCKVMLDRSGTESYALVQFENQDHADQCLRELNGSTFRGCPISLSWQFPKNSPYQYPTRQNSTSSSNNRLSWKPDASPPGDQASRRDSWQSSRGPASPTMSWNTPMSPTSAPVGWNSPPPTPTVAAGWSSPPPPVSGTAANGQWNSPTPSWGSPSQTGWHQPGSLNAQHSVDPHAPAFVPTQKQSSGNSTTTNTTPHAWETSSNASNDAASNDSSLDGKNLYIKNLDEQVDNLELFNLFRKYGRIVSARVMKDESSGQSKGFGFVSFEAEEQATRALRELNGKKVGAKSLVVNIAEPKSYREKKLAAYHASKTTATTTASKPLTPTSPKPVFVPLPFSPVTISAPRSTSVSGSEPAEHPAAAAAELAAGDK